MTYRQICDAFRAAGIESAEWDAELLLEHFCGADRLGLRAEPDRVWSSPALAAAVEKRASRYPLQYLLGEWAFYRQTYEVSPDCLIPRADTEILVEEAIKRLPKNARFADLCTGSGCIAIAMADLRPDLSGCAVELYPATLEIAKRNAQINRVASRLTFIEGDVLSGEVLGDEKFEAIISNPPYIRSEIIETLSREVRHEPRAALDGGEDGLIFYRTIVEKYQRNLSDGGVFIFEIGYDQADAIKEIASANSFSARIIKDLGGCDRVAILSRTKD